MDERERDYLKQQIRQLERSIRRWKLATLGLVTALAIFLIVGAVSSFLFGVLGVHRLREEAMIQQEQRARDAEQAARLQAEQAALQLQQMEKQAKAMREKIPK